MKINMNSQEFKLYVIYDFTEDSEKISVQNATKAAEEYVEAYFPYYDANSDESPSACGMWNSEVEGLNSVYYHQNDNNELFLIFEFDLNTRFEYDI